VGLLTFKQSPEAAHLQHDNHRGCFINTQQRSPPRHPHPDRQLIGWAAACKLRWSGTATQLHRWNETEEQEECCYPGGGWKLHLARCHLLLLADDGMQQQQRRVQNGPRFALFFSLQQRRGCWL